jgi:hypothetical protein
VVAVEPAPRARGVFALVVEESDLVGCGISAHTGQVCVHEQARAEAVMCELEFGKLEEIVGVGARVVREEAPVGSDNEDTKAGVFGAAEYKQGVRVRRPCKRQGAGEFIRKLSDDGRGRGGPKVGATGGAHDRGW